MDALHRCGRAIADDGPGGVDTLLYRHAGLSLDFRYQDFYAGIRAGGQVFHLKLVDDADPSIEYVDDGDHFHLYLEVDDAAAIARALAGQGVRLVKPVTDTPWGTREFVIKDDQGHTLYVGERLARVDGDGLSRPATGAK